MSREGQWQISIYSLDAVNPPQEKADKGRSFAEERGVGCVAKAQVVSQSLLLLFWKGVSKCVRK
jgi:hypothetical protein